MVNHIDRARLRGSNLVENYRGTSAEDTELAKIQRLVADVLHYAAFKGLVAAAVLEEAVRMYNGELGL